MINKYKDIFFKFKEKYESIKLGYLDIDEIEDDHPMWDFMSDVSILIDSTQKNITEALSTTEKYNQEIKTNINTTGFKNEKNIEKEYLSFIKSKSESSKKNRIINDYLTSLVNKTYQDINNPKLQHAYQDILIVQNFLRAELDIYEKFEDSKKNNYDKDQVEDLEELNSSKSSNSL